MKNGLCPDFPLMVNDWLSSTRIAVMSPAQEGALLHLLLHAWSEPDCTLPDDPEVLAELSRLRGEWPLSGSKVRNCFVPDTQRPGRIFNEKQRSIRAAQNTRISAASEHGKKAAQALWSKRFPRRTLPEHSPSNAQAMPEHSSSNASYSSPLTRLPSDKAYKRKRGGKLSENQKRLSDWMEQCLGIQWKNDAGKWVNRIKEKPAKSERVIAEVANAIKENRINETPAQYAEDKWKEFA